jgi:hypothetical protein
MLLHLKSDVCAPCGVLGILMVGGFSCGMWGKDFQLQKIVHYREKL